MFFFKAPRLTFRIFSRRETKMITLTFILQQHNIIIDILEDQPKNSSGLIHVGVTVPLWGWHELFFNQIYSLYWPGHTMLSLSNLIYLSIFSSPEYDQKINKIRNKNKKISANMTRISHDDSARHLHAWLAFVLHHSSLQGMKMSNKWHHCCV